MESIQDAGMFRIWLIGWLICPMVALASPSVGYAQATAYLKQKSRPTLYQPLNVLDGREITAWCAPTADPLAASLTFGFEQTVTIDEIHVYTGNGFDQDTFSKFARAKKFLLQGVEGETTFTVADRRGQQTVQLNPPMTGARFVLELLDSYPPEDPQQPVCMSDVVFYSHGKPLNGPWLTRKLKFNRSRAPILGTWFSGYTGAPNRFLSFFFDSTYLYVYQPFDTTQHQPQSFHGSYRIRGHKLQMKLPGKGWVTTHVTFGKDKDASGHPLRTLGMEGGLSKLLEAKFRNRP